ncbi:MAG: hypothetical protein R3B90_21745 [Planctomycetaceae bacterium]
MRTPNSRLLIYLAAASCLFLFAGLWAGIAIEADSPESLAPAVAMAAVPVFGRRDASLRVTKALPGSATTISSDGIDTMTTVNGHQLADVEYEVQAPALTTAELPDTQTMIYLVQHAASSDFSDAVTLHAAFITQTGADGAGAAAQTKRFRLTADAGRYLRVRATKSGAGSAATKSLTFEPVV